MERFRNSVGQDCPNHKEDVIRVVNKLKEIPPANGGFKGLPDQPLLAPAEAGTYNQYLGEVIARFQERNNLGYEYKHFKGKIAVDKGVGGKTWQKMVALAAGPTVVVQAVTPTIATIAAEQGAKQKVEKSPVASSGDLDWFIKHLTGGTKTQWTLGGTGGFGAGAGPMNVQAGSITILRPDGSELKYGLAGAGLGVSLAPGSISYSGDGFPSGSGSVYRGRLASATPLTDDHFSGKMLILSGSVTAPTGHGGGISICYFGIDDAYWGALQARLKEEFSKAVGHAVVGSLLTEAMDHSCAVAGIWGTQIGSPDAGISISLCAAIKKERLNWFGFRSFYIGLAGAILTED